MYRSPHLQLCKRSAIRATASLALILLAGAPASLPAQVPGVTLISTSPVDFPTPPSVAVLLRSDGQFEATFSLQPENPAEPVFLAGTFNHWSRSITPMEDPDGDGTFSSTLILEEGDYEYKFVTAGGEWFADPGNPNTAGAVGNSLLRLGISALLEGRTASRGDGVLEERAILHDSALHRYRDALAPDDVILRLRTVKDDPESVLLQFNLFGEWEPHEMRRVSSDALFEYYEYHLTRSLPGGGEYRFLIQDGETTLETEVYRLDENNAPEFKTPDWARDAIWYQLLPDRFRDGDPSNNPEFTPGTNRTPFTSSWTHDPRSLQDWERTNPDGSENTELFPRIYERLYGGDFQGIIDKLDYIQSIGINAIYLNPIFEAHSHHKYNGKSYVHADDGLGVPGEFARSLAKKDPFDATTWELNASDEKFFEVLSQAKKRNIRVIIDGVFNHLGNDAPAYLDLLENGKDSPYAGWYDVVSWDPLTVRGWAGFDGLPQFAKNEEHGLADPTLREHIFAATRRWMDPNGDGDPSDGIDGWRLDVPMDVPMAFWREWRQVVKDTNPDAYIVGEVWDPADEWLDGTTMDAVMNYQFRKHVLEFFGNVNERITASEFDNRLASLRIRYPRAATEVLQNLMDSHDTDRIASRLMNPDLTEDPNYDGRNRIQDTGPDYNDSQPTERVYDQLKLIAVFQATYVGAPMIYYGTEVGMYGADDPLCRNPMWWPDLEPRDNPGFVIRNDLFEHYQALFRLRSEHPALRRGDFTTLLADDEKEVYVFLRHIPNGGEAILVALNNSDSEQAVYIPPPSVEILPNSFEQARVLFGEGTTDYDGGDMQVVLPPQGSAIMLVTRTAE